MGASKAEPMDSLWKWMMRANAAAVLYCGIALLALLVSFFVWREFEPVTAAGAPPAGRPRLEPGAPLGLQAFLDAALSRSADPPGDPFRNPRPPRPPPMPEPPRVVKTPPPPSPSPAPPPKRETVRLTYRGLYQTSESDVRALIEDSKRRRSAFYRVGEVLFGMKIREIRMLEVSLLPANGSDVTLKLGEPYEFEERPNGY